MSARKVMRIVGGLLGVVTMAACTASPAPPQGAVQHHRSAPNPAGSHAARTSPSRPITRADVARCPKTVTSHPAALPGQSPADSVPPGATIYGNGKLFVTLNANGVIVAPARFVNRDGSIEWKFPWWRYVSGQLTITGHRVDAPAPPLTSDVPVGYGDIGFQASGVAFPSEGCWQVTATVDHHTSLTFVTFVVQAAHSGLISSRA
ncbi:MAG: hypothetical protein J2P27_02545 [Actinobacteria bacterium]|nr:hypothetical protein [Actinomycetota bacterium]